MRWQPALKQCKGQPSLTSFNSDRHIQILLLIQWLWWPWPCWPSWIAVQMRVYPGGVCFSKPTEAAVAETTQRCFHTNLKSTFRGKTISQMCAEASALWFSRRRPPWTGAVLNATSSVKPDNVGSWRTSNGADWCLNVTQKKDPLV